MLCDDNNQCHIIDYSNKKSRRVVHSIMGGELYIFTEAFDAGFTLVNDIRTALAQFVPLRIFTDSKQVFDVITRGKRPTERRLAIDPTGAREAYERREIDRVGLVRGLENPADSLTKLRGNSKLKQLIETSMDETPVQDWIVRNDNGTQAI